MARRRYASVKDVAAAAGVSYQTASKVLNGGDVRVSDQTARRIRAAAAGLRYSPNTLARSLARQATGTIGIITADPGDVAAAQFLATAEQAAHQHGQAVLAGQVRPGERDGADVVRMLTERRADGLIVAAPQVESELEFAARLRAHGPAVSLYPVPGGGIPVLGPDHRAAGRLATGHLLALGHTEIATVTGPLRQRAARTRLTGYSAAFRDAGREMDEDIVAEADWTPAGAAAATRLLLRHRPRITAIFVQSDEMALGVLSELSAAGARVPADVAVTGCGDLPFAGYVNPALSTVRVPLAEIATRATALLMDAIGGELAAAPPVILPVSLVVRGSCGAPPRPPQPQPQLEEAR
jgi:LacI family transcriptional regulator, galactose operon repressor